MNERDDNLDKCLEEAQFLLERAVEYCDLMAKKQNQTTASQKVKKHNVPTS
jgi:hypothetical protein